MRILMTRDFRQKENTTGSACVSNYEWLYLFVLLHKVSDASSHHEDHEHTVSDQENKGRVN